MRLSFFLPISVFILVIFLTSCSGNRIPDGEMPDVGIPMDQANQDMEIYSPEGYQNSFKNGKKLTLHINVVSEYSIHFPMDYGTKLFAYQDGQWIEIQNRMHYPTIEEYGENIVLPSKDDFLKQGVFSVVPYQPELEKATPVRLIIIGNVMHNGKANDNFSVGYFDFVLSP